MSAAIFPDCMQSTQTGHVCKEACAVASAACNSHTQDGTHPPCPNPHLCSGVWTSYHTFERGLKEPEQQHARTPRVHSVHAQALHSIQGGEDVNMGSDLLSCLPLFHCISTLTDSCTHASLHRNTEQLLQQSEPDVHLCTQGPLRASTRGITT